MSSNFAWKGSLVYAPPDESSWRLVGVHKWEERRDAASRLGAATSPRWKIELDASLALVFSDWVDTIDIKKVLYTDKNVETGRASHWAYQGEFSWPRASENGPKKPQRERPFHFGAYVMQDPSSERLTWASIKTVNDRTGIAVSFLDEQALAEDQACPFDPGK